MLLQQRSLRRRCSVPAAGVRRRTPHRRHRVAACRGVAARRGGRGSARMSTASRVGGEDVVDRDLGAVGSSPALLGDDLRGGLVGHGDDDLAEGRPPCGLGHLLVPPSPRPSDAEDLAEAAYRAMEAVEASCRQRGHSMGRLASACPALSLAIAIRLYSSFPRSDLGFGETFGLHGIVRFAIRLPIGSAR